MGRLANIQKAGFYPFFPEHYPAVLTQLQAPENPTDTWMLDPCAGEGVFARYLSTHLGLKLATVELNSERGDLCRQVSDHHINCDAMAVEAHKAQVALVWSNPPFMRDAEMRLEWKFLRRFLDILIPGGVLAYTIPRTTMQRDHHILRHLVEYYHDHRLFSLPDPNPYGQIVLFARKRQERERPGKEGTADLINTLLNPPPLPAACDRPLAIPSHPRSVLVLRGTAVDWEQLRREAEAAPLELGQAMAPPGVIEGRSIMPPRRGHIASLMAGGGLDNCRVGDEIVKGYVRRIEVDQPISDEDKAAGVTELKQTVYDPQIARFNPDTGEYHLHTSNNGLGDYLTDNAAGLSQALIGALDPAYNFDLDDQPDYAQYILKNMARHMQVPGKPAGLWPGQRHVGAALDVAFRDPEAGGLGRRGGVLVASMGWGKSLEAAAQLALYYKRRPKDQWKPAWVITEPHLVDELAGTIRSAYPGAFVDVVTDLAEVIAFLGLESDPTLGRLPRVAVLSKEAFKNGSGAEPAVTVDYRRLHNVTDEEGNPLPAFRCPDCGRLQVISHDCNLGPAGRLVTDIAYFHRPRRCCYDVIDTEDGRVIRMGCSRPEHYEPWEADRSGSCGYLYQQARSIGRTGIYEGQGQDGFERVDGIARGELDPRRLTPARPGLARMPIADYLSQLHPDQVGLVIWDEAHTAKGQSTDAGHALAAIAQVADHILLMTGTLFGGKASSVFHLAHRINPAFRRRWRWDQLQTFVERYGVLERKTIEKEYEEISDRGTTTTKTRRNTYVRELAGCSPALVSLFLGFTIFTGLGDLGISLPRLSRRLIHAPPDEDHQLLYDRYREVCVETLQDAKEADVDLGGSLLHTLRGVAVSPWRPEYLKRKIVKPVNGRMRHTRTRIYASANSLDWRCAGCGRSLPNYGHLGSPNRLRCHHCYPGNAEGSAAWKEALGGHRPLITHQNGRLFSAEQALIDELLAQKERDRRCLVFVCQTDTRDITPRLIELCRRHGLEALRCDVPPRKRGAWFEKYAPYADVVFVNPEACKTGLNLTMFSTVIWFEIPYSLYTLKQAAARVRRPTSTADVIEEIYVNVPGTIVEDALALVFDKMTAAAIFRGESAEQALQVIKGTGNMTADLIARVAERAKGRADDLEALFARYNREDEASEGSGEPAEPLATSVEDSQAERARQMAEEARKVADKLVTFDATFGDDNAIEAAGQASVQMSLFS